MDLSTSMKFVMMRAQSEAAAAKKSEVSPELLFLGILKLAEKRAEEFAPTSRHKAETNADIDAVRQQFAQKSIDSSRTRGLLRAVIAGGAHLGGEKELTECLVRSADLAGKRGESDLWAQDVLAAILACPSDAILQVCPLKKQGADKAEDAKDEPTGEANGAGEKTDEMSRDFLPALTSRIRHMRAKLLSTVHGQDHVVHV